MKVFKWIFSFIRTHRIITVIILIFLGILFFIFRPKPAAPIATERVKRGDIVQTVSVTGSIVAKNTANLTFPIGGTISWIGVMVDDNVTAGQVIATLDQRTVLKNLQQALIAYSEQRNTFDQTLFNNGNAKSPQDAVNDTMKRILQNNQFDLDKSVNSVELQDLARQQSILTTPISGIVTHEDTTTAGTTALAGTTSFTVVDPTSMVFNMDVDEADIGRVQAGQKVSLTLDAFPNTTLSLPVDTIDFVSHTTSNGGNAYTVDVKLQNTNMTLYRVGMNGNADIVTGEKHDVLTIPIASITNTNQVYVKTPRGFHLQTVSLGLQSDTDTEVTSGLSEGDSIALDPTQVAKK